MNVVLWVLQVILALQFLLHGVLMLAPPAEAPPMLQYVYDVPAALRIFIGVVEILAGIGLILPGLLKIQPRLIPLAALGLMIIMALAAVFHIRRSEPFAGNIVLFVLAGLVAYGRWRIKPLPTRPVLQRSAGSV